MSVRMIVWVDTVDDTEEFIRGLGDRATPYAGFDDDGFYLQVDLTTVVDDNQLTLPVDDPATDRGPWWEPRDPELDSARDLPDPHPAEEVDGASASDREEEGGDFPATPAPGDGTDAPPAPSTADLRSEILAVLHDGPATAQQLADEVVAGKDQVMEELRDLRDAGKVEPAGRAGWKLRQRSIDYDAARARAAAAI
jgi:DNA-binding transcriptional ArsR family regulator